MATANTTDLELESLLNEQEYARITKRSLASVRRDRLVRQGCPYVKLGALVRYRPSDVRAYLEHHLRRPAREQARDGSPE
jgi:phage terminase Nu1 subunit (DNA packaging protein)